MKSACINPISFPALLPPWPENLHAPNIEAAGSSENTGDGVVVYRKLVVVQLEANNAFAGSALKKKIHSSVELVHMHVASCESVCWTLDSWSTLFYPSDYGRLYERMELCQKECRSPGFVLKDLSPRLARASC